ncbi:hypothetical protein [Dongia rigui]|uniref:Uncharacterized protein n=1 Tax=Dongia rigui TaxID=940149 RepID=A0ABU5DYS8_9PROT|nr:hypothetical protein [Dongia rigui]MDY0872089.1 hypothetical protein [Dongia rigui]
MGNLEKTVESTQLPPPVDADKLRKRRNNIAVMVLLGVDVLVGAGIAAAGVVALQSDAIAVAGAALATIGLLLMLVYQLVGRER